MIRGFSAQAVRDAEEPALAAGRPLMRNAAYALAARTIALLARHHIPVPGARALVLVGGGNNGGDGLFAAADLVARGVQTTCLLAHPRPHEGGLAAARRAGARLMEAAEPFEADVVAELGAWADVWLDALAGIGIQGALRGLPARVVAALAPVRTGAPVDPLVVAVDTPSGISADPGANAETAQVLPADMTVTMGATKAGLLIPPGAAAAGRVDVVDLDLGADFARQVPTVFRLTPADVADLWPVPHGSDHKYTRGVVGLYAGSAQYPGAGLLCAGAAAGVGVGMVRYLGHPDVAAEVIRAHPEVVPAPGRVQSLVIGPGMADDDELTTAMTHALRGGDPGRPGDTGRDEPVAVVLDAGALDHLPDDPEALAARPVVLTPHAGELQRLLERLGTTVGRADIEADPWRWAHTAAARTGTTVLLKGAITVIAPPEGTGFAQADGAPWLATAGTGDVLAGILGAMLAQAAQEELATGDIAARAAAAVVVHGRAARLAGAPLRASHLAHAVPDAVASLLES